MENLIPEFEPGLPPKQSVSHVYQNLQSAFQQVLSATEKFTLQPSPDNAGTISFYKDILPVQLSLVYQYSTYLNHIIHSPTDVLDDTRFLPVLQDEYTILKRNHQPLYIYFRCNITDKDTCFFIPGAENLILVSAPYNYISVSIAIPSASDVYAKFLAFEQLISQFQNVSIPVKDMPALKWHGSQAALTELIYALNEMGVLEGRRNEIRKLRIIFEKMFLFDLGNIYKTYENIRMRKKSRTPFLDGLRNALLRKMDDDDLNAL
jgi:hypothetical protein